MKAVNTTPPKGKVKRFKGALGRRNHVKKAYVTFDAGNRHFSDRIDLRWSKGLGPLRMMLIASREVGELFAEKLKRSKAKKGILKRKTLMILHMRAYRTTLEILTLIENGFPDGAYARWRTLYEITVVAFFKRIVQREGCVWLR